MKTKLALSFLACAFFAALQTKAQTIEVTSTGVGIGTSTPAGILHVVTPVSTDTNQPRFLSGSSTAGTWNEILLGANVSSYGAVMLRYTNGQGTGSSALLSIAHYGDSTTNGINLKGGGNVGIGNTNPSRRLSVQSASTPNQEIADFLAPSLSSGNVIYALMGRAGASGESGLWGYQYDSTTSNSFLWLCNYGDGHTTGGLTIRTGGNVGIGTSSPSYKLHVSGSVRATSFISDTTTYADFVFKPGYKLASLSEVESAIKTNGHLPGIPSEAEAKAKGVDLGKMQVTLLQKVEELTLYLVAHEKELQQVRSENESLRRRVSELEKR